MHLVSVKENTQSIAGLFIYPNPSNSTVSIKVDELNKNMNYSVVNTMGQLVLQGKLTNLVTTLNVSSLATGVYIINVTTENGSNSVKLIKYD